MSSRIAKEIDEEYKMKLALEKLKEEKRLKEWKSFQQSKVRIGENINIDIKNKERGKKNG